MKAQTQDRAPYLVTPKPTIDLSDDAAVLKRAGEILAESMRRGPILNGPQVCRDFLCIKLGTLPHEVFACIWLDSQNRMIDYEEVFRGTLTQTSVYPREIVKLALQHNAAGVILAHNHPSGVPEPSYADEALTRALKQSLALVDVKVLDHFVIAGNLATSFAERGLL